MSTDNLGFFYGGAPGKNLAIQKTFSNAASLATDLSLGYGSDVKVGDYVLINYGNYYDVSNSINPIYQSNLNIDATYFTDTKITKPSGISKFAPKNYNASLWQKYFDNGIVNNSEENSSDVITNYTYKIGYKKIIHLTGPTPVIDINPVQPVSPAVSPSISENLDNIDRPALTFSLPRAVNFYSTYDVLNANNPLDNSNNIVQGHFDGTDFYQAILQTAIVNNYYHDIVLDKYYNMTSAGMVEGGNSSNPHDDGFVQGNSFYSRSKVTGSAQKYYYDMYSAEYYLYKQTFTKNTFLTGSKSILFGYYNTTNSRCYLDKMYTIKGDITEELSEDTWFIDLKTNKVYYRNAAGQVLTHPVYSTVTVLDSNVFGTLTPNTLYLTPTTSPFAITDADANMTNIANNYNGIVFGYYNDTNYSFYNNVSFISDNLASYSGEFRGCYFIDRTTLKVYTMDTESTKIIPSTNRACGYYDSIKDVFYNDALFTQIISDFPLGTWIYNLTTKTWYDAGNYIFKGPYTNSTIDGINQLLINRYFYSGINFSNLNTVINVPTSVINSTSLTFKEKDCYIDNVKYGLIFECTSTNDLNCTFIYKGKLRLGYPAVEIQSLPYFKNSNVNDKNINVPKLMVESSDEINDNVVYNLVNLPNFTADSNVTVNDSSAELEKVDDSTVKIQFALQRGNKFIGKYAGPEYVGAYADGVFTNFTAIGGPMIGDFYYNTGNTTFYKLDDINGSTLTWTALSGSVTSAIKIDYYRTSTGSLTSLTPDKTNAQATTAITATVDMVGKTCVCTYSNAGILTSDLFVGISTGSPATYSWLKCGPITATIKPAHEKETDATLGSTNFYNTYYINSLEDRIAAIESALALQVK